jgi:hypothetical protein
MRTGFIHAVMYLFHSFTIERRIATVDVVPSHAFLFVFSAASLVNITHMFSNLSLRNTFCATVTQSLVTVGYEFSSVKITFVHLGHRVEHTASATTFTPFKIFDLTSSLNIKSLNIL